MRVLIKIVTHIGPKTRISSRLDYDQNDYPNDEWKGPAKKNLSFQEKLNNLMETSPKMI